MKSNKLRVNSGRTALCVCLLAVCGFTFAEAQAQIASLVPTRLDFAGKGATAGAKEVVLRNLDPQSALTVESVQASGGFSQANNCGILQPGESCLIRVSFNPLAAGHTYGAITVHSDAAGSPHVISLSGMANQAAAAIGLASELILSADALEFPAQPAGRSSAWQTVTLTNRSGEALSLQQISVSGGFHLFDGQPGDCTSSLTPHKSCELRVTFAPKQAGWMAGAVTIETGNGRRVVSLSGTATASSVARFAYAQNAAAYNPMATFTVDPALGELRQTGYVIPPGYLYSPYPDPLGRFLYTQEGYENIHTWGVNAQTGALTSIEDIGVAFLTGNLAIHPSGQFLYVNDTYTDNGRVTAYTISSTGQLTAGSSYGLGISSGNISVDPTGRFLYAHGFNNYSGNANVNIFSIDPQTGNFTPIAGSPFSNIYSTPSSFDPSGRFAFAPLLAGSCGYPVTVYSIDQTSGALTEVPGSPFPPGGCGGMPSPSGLFFYLSTFRGTLVGWSVNQTTGALTELAGSPFKISQDDGLAGIDPSGNFIYFVNGIYNRIDTYGLDAKTGALKSLVASVPGNGFPGSNIGFITGSTAVTYAPTYTYVSNQGSNNVSGYSISPKTGALTQVAGSPFAAGSSPSSVGARPLSNFVYVANSASNTVSAFTSTSKGALVPIAGSPYSTGHAPASALVDPSGQYLYVSNSADNTVSGFLINQTSGALSPMTGSPFAISGTGPVALATDPSGTVLFVGNELSKSIAGYYINLTNGTLAEVTGSPFSFSFAPDALATDPQGLYLYACDASLGKLHTFSIAFYLPFLQEAGSPHPVGSDPAGIVADPTGRYLYVANHGSNNVSGFSINEANGHLTALSGSPFSAGSDPSSISVDVSGKFVLVTNAGSGNVSVFKIGSAGGLTQVSGSPFAAGTSPSAAAAEGSVH
jgi:6-phosphogluconolactonase